MMRSRLGGTTYGVVATAVALVLGLGACDDSSTAPAGSARLSVLLTDAPGDVAEAWVNISGIYAQGGAHDGWDNEWDGQSYGDRHGNGPGSWHGDGHMDGGRVWLREDPTGWINLMTLADDVEQIVDGAVMPSGTYRQLRFIIEEAAIVTEGGRTYATAGADLGELNAQRGGDPLVSDGLLNCPGCDRSGIKVMCRDGVVASEDGETIIIADFDVGQSFGHERGHSGRWVMHPVIRCLSMRLVGSIAGTVSPADGVELPMTCGSNYVSLRAFKPLAIDADQEVWSGHTSPHGWFKIQPLQPGPYDLSYESEVEFDDGSVVTFSASASPTSVNVEAGVIAEADYTIDDAQCNPGGSGS